MERLTAKLDGKGVIMLPSGAEHDWCIGARKVGDVTIQYLSGTAADRLTAYEDTGLTPDAVAQLKQIAEIFNCDPNDPAQLKQLCDKLRGWQQAEQSGRLVVREKGGVDDA